MINVSIANYRFQAPKIYISFIISRRGYEKIEWIPVHIRSMRILTGSEYQLQFTVAIYLVVKSKGNIADKKACRDRTLSQFHPTPSHPHNLIPYGPYYKLTLW
jgi:hypothetical protein